jgi:hypothetical protein
MAGYFSKEDIETLRQGRQELPAQLASLREAYILRSYKNEKAAEFARQGFCRRLGTLVQAIELTFELLPPELEEIPDRKTVVDATIAIQAFVMNCFGCLENLAWIWVLEKNVKGKGGRELDRNEVGFGKKYVKPSFSDKFKAYLDSRKEWLVLLSQNELRVSAARLPTQKLGWTDAGCWAPGGSAGYEVFSCALGRCDQVFAERVAD